MMQTNSVSSSNESLAPVQPKNSKTWIDAHPEIILLVLLGLMALLMSAG
jgi:hypothetical protein